MARVQRIESDSAFSSANVLSGTVLTYKTFQDGRVVHKAKLSNGSVVEITPEVDFSPYYTSEQINSFLVEISDSLSRLSSNFTALDSRVTTIEHKATYVTAPVILESNSTSGFAIGLSIDTNVFSVSGASLTTQLTFKKLGTAAPGYAATYQLQGSNGSAIGDKINVIQDILIHSGYLITAASSDHESNSSVIVGDPYVKLQLRVQRSDSAGAYDNIYIPVKDLVDTYTAGNGLTLVQGQFYIQANSNSNTDKYLEIGTSTIGLKGIDQKISSVRSQLIGMIQGISDSTSIGNYYTKVEIDAFLTAISDSLSALNSRFDSYYTKGQVDQLLEDLSDSVDLSNYYTKSQIDTLFQNFSDSYLGFNYRQISQNTTAVDKDFLICRNSLTVTLPDAVEGYLIGISTGSTGSNVSVVPAAGDTIETSASDSTSQGILIQESHSFILLYGTSSGWTIAGAAIKPISTAALQQILSNYYTKGQVDALLSDSSGAQAAQAVTESFSSVDTSNCYTLQHKGVPFGVVADSGKYYPIEKFSVELELSSTKLKVTPYMAYQNMSAFTGTWKVIYTKLD